MTFSKKLLAGCVAASVAGALFVLAVPAQADINAATIQGGFYRAPYGFGGFGFQSAGEANGTCAVGDRLEWDAMGTKYWTRVRVCD